MKSVTSFNRVVSQLIKLSVVARIKLCQLIFIYSCWANEFCGSFLWKTSFDHVSSLLAKVKCRYLFLSVWLLICPLSEDNILDGFLEREIEQELAASMPWIYMTLQHLWDWCTAVRAQTPKPFGNQAVSLSWVSWVLLVFALVYLLKFWKFPHVYGCTVSNCFWYWRLNQHGLPLSFAWFQRLPRSFIQCWIQ